MRCNKKNLKKKEVGQNTGLVLWYTSYS